MIASKIKYYAMIFLSLIFLSCALCFVSIANATATTANMVDNVSFYVVEGASIRYGIDGHNGLRYEIRMKANEYDALKKNDTYSSVSFGILIAPKSYLTAGHELNKANVFGVDGTAIYDWATLENGEWVYNDSGKVRITNFETDYLNSVSNADYVRYYGSIVDIRDGSITESNPNGVNNIDREFYGVGYIKYTVGGQTDYRFATDVIDDDGEVKPLADNTTRSIAYVTQKAITAVDEMQNPTDNDLNMQAWIRTNYLENSNST